ncbi:hypothetical protein PBY51_012859 [Eleginops maclovinus]|uniref:Lipocalin/cytosolic fatty-acid binding domain-containing protein n=1 Tax=Eleginops maclovinus TaxID=56733 RepID=A0AAN7Y7R0_ELEMC|nr:hypothetical protein PBY51_012859 [Eleginops maclovinus]
MMKTLCVAAVVLSLSSVCQPAPLACEKLLQPADKAPDLTGNWRYLAVSTKICLWSLFVRNVLWPSVEMDITFTETPNELLANLKVKTLGGCINASNVFVYENSRFSGKCKMFVS